jgi:hypothetical protein
MEQNNYGKITLKSKRIYYDAILLLYKSDARKGNCYCNRNSCKYYFIIATGTGKHLLFCFAC